MIWQITLLLFAIWASLVWYKNRDFRNMENLINSDLPYWPLIGNAHLFMGNAEARMNGIIMSARNAIKYGISSLYLGPRHYVVMADPVIADIILKSSLQKDGLMDFFKYIIGNGNIFAPVSIWRPRRKILVPTFSPKNLNMFVKIFSHESSILVDLLEKNTSQGSFSVWNYMTTYTMDSVFSSTLGIKINSQTNPEHPFLKAVDDITGVLAMRLFHPFLYSDLVFQLLYGKIYNKRRSYVWELVDEIIKDKRKELKEKQKITAEKSTNDNKIYGMKTFLEMLIEKSGEEQGYTDKELQEEVIVLIVAGTDTSAVGSSFVLCQLARHPKIQDKVYDEIYRVFGDSKRPLIAEDLPKLKFTEAVIKETLRLFPPVPITTRVIAEDITLPSGVTLVKGTNIINCIWGMHRNPVYWGDDAEEFRPDRFLEQPLKHPAAFIPFSYGPRNCPGYQYAMMSMKTAVSSILRRYKVLSPPGQLGPLRCTFEVMMKDADRFNIQLEKRS